MDFQTIRLRGRVVFFSRWTHGESARVPWKAGQEPQHCDASLHLVPDAARNIAGSGGEDVHQAFSRCAASCQRQRTRSDRWRAAHPGTAADQRRYVASQQGSRRLYGGLHDPRRIARAVQKGEATEGEFARHGGQRFVEGNVNQRLDAGAVERRRIAEVAPVADAQGCVRNQPHSKRVLGIQPKLLRTAWRAAATLQPP